MKILMISHEYPPVGGGGANACMNLAKEFAISGHDVDIVTVWFSGLQEAEVINDYSGRIRLYRLKAQRRYLDHSSFIEMFDYLLKAKGVSDKMVKEAKHDKRPYDICQVFFGIPSGPIGLSLKRKYGLPYAVRFGGGDIPGAQARFSVIYELLSPVIKSIWKNAGALIANSLGLRKRAMDYCNKYEVSVIPNGVDSDH